MDVSPANARHASPTNNPWSDAADRGEPGVADDPNTALPPSLFDLAIVNGLQSASITDDSPPARPPKDVLRDFDPLASLEEKAAREAWQSSEGHLPSPPAPPTTPPVPPIKDLVATPPTSPSSSGHTSSLSASSFPSFASLARTFALPTLSRPRPLSLDGAKPVPSPPTLSALEAQQEFDRDQCKPLQSPRPVTPLSDSRPTSPRSGKDGEVPFDFQHFLDQMKSRSAEPVSKYLRSFLSNFAKRIFTVNDQVKIINDFLNFIAVQMRACDVWKNATASEFDNAMEGMEKLVMNRLYDFTFTPQVIYCVPPRPVTTDDLERDRVLSQRIALFGWVGGKHLDIPEGEGGAGFLMFAQQELVKINHYKAPRDKLICILNCCKIIFGFIRHLKKEESADAFIPVLIFVVLKANPDHLLSNVEFINRFRNPDKLQSEAGYYLSSLMGAVSFIETMDHTSLSNITQDEFETNVESAIQALPLSSPPIPHHQPYLSPAQAQTEEIRPVPLPKPTHAGEESAQPLSLPTPAQISEDAKRFLQKTGDTISKPLSAIGRIFSEALDGAAATAESKLSYLPGPFAPYELGREREQQQQHGQGQEPGIDSASGWVVPQTPLGNMSAGGQIQTPYKPRVRRVPSPSLYTPSPPSTGLPMFGSPENTHSRVPVSSNTGTPISLGTGRTPPPHLLPPSSIPPRMQPLVGGAESISRTPTPGLNLSEIQAQIDAAHEHATTASKGRLVQMFPAVESVVVEWVLEANGGDLGKSIEKLLEISTE